MLIVLLNSVKWEDIIICCATCTYVWYLHNCTALVSCTGCDVWMWWYEVRCLCDDVIVDVNCVIVPCDMIWYHQICCATCTYVTTAQHWCVVAECGVWMWWFEVKCICDDVIVDVNCVIVQCEMIWYHQICCATCAYGSNLYNCTALMLCGREWCGCDDVRWSVYVMM